MRLINTSSLKLTEFFDNEAREYAILSHVWGQEEVSYEEFQAEATEIEPSYRSKAGYKKIVDLCKLASDGLLNRDRGFTKYQWAWIDTVCIDKRSSAELSEAINSMYKWYEKSAVCVVFLPDVTVPDAKPHSGQEDLITVPGHSTFSREQFKQSAWFTRGWTLQELTAPRFILFFDTAFRTIGTITKAFRHSYYKGYGLNALHRAAAEAASMNPYVLQHTSPADHAGSIDIVLPWAAHRVTTREEDMSYCLLGLCQVNMPLLYGEGGDRAFRRLQLEIISSNPDLSIYTFSQEKDKAQGMLARHVSQFAAAQGRSIRNWRSKLLTRTPRGLEFEVCIPKGLRRRYSEHFTVLLTMNKARTNEERTYVLFRLRPSSFSMAYDDGYIEAQRIGCFGSSSESELSLWKQTLGWRPLDRSWLEALAPRDLDFQYGGQPLSTRERGRELMYRFYPAKTIRLWVPL